MQRVTAFVTAAIAVLVIGLDAQSAWEPSLSVARPSASAGRAAVGPVGTSVPAPGPASLPTSAAIARAGASVPQTIAADAAPVTLAAILQAVGTYLAQYGPALSLVLAEEDYTQRMRGSATPAVNQTRHLRSDMTFVTDARAGWGAFRDVFEVDGQQVRDRDERVARVLTSDAGLGGRKAAMQMAAESARFNLNVVGVSVDRTLNVPIVALPYWLPKNQPRSDFKLDRIETVRAVRTAVVEFQERAQPRLIASKDDVAMHGVGWIDVDSGRLMRTTVSYTTSAAVNSGASGNGRVETSVTIDVTFGEDPGLGIAVPSSMDERYEGVFTGILPATLVRAVRGGRPPPDQSVVVPLGTITAHATYTHFQRFTVTVGTEMK